MNGDAAVVAGLGTALPERVVTNHELAQSSNISDEWIRTRTGICERRWVNTGTATGDLAVDAGARALRSAGTDQVDLVVVATTTPDYPCPATAPEVASRLNLGTVAAFDLSAVCSGFIYALAMAASAIQAGTTGSALVVGADTYSTIVNPADRTTSVIFGDGAGAVVLRASRPHEQGTLLCFDLGSDGRARELIMVPAGGARQRTSASEPTATDFYLTMHGKDVFTHAVTRMTESSRTLLAHLGWNATSVDRIVPHQANVRILHSVAKSLGVATERVVVNLDRVGNTSAASIPLALAHAVTHGEIKSGDRVLLTAFGAGLTWGSTALVWPQVRPVTTA